MDVLSDPKVKVAVDYRAAWLAECCSSIGLEDARQQMWLEAIQLKPRFCASSGVAFSTFLFSHLRFRAINIVKSTYSKRRVETEWALAHKMGKVDPPEEPLDMTVSRIRKALNKTDQKVLDQLIDPSPELLKISSRRNSDLRTSRRKIANVHLACYFKVSEMTISRSVRHIEKVVKQAVAGRAVSRSPRGL